ncbi:hypothetical protein [Halorubrum kocurii]|uniref:Glutamate--cysteine ligase n=1 Tax=Halorubrum kocurii JCM 14978 TaxID=1230456 RepID=M0NM55_9EURY|nr:hypothetical protein [Halorubrum kocurii]EMA59007.1 hypothetical protein C468_15257 [Halorubrum kocurii JCM 14978]
MSENRETVTGIRESGRVDIDAFERRVREEADGLKERLASGTFDNRQATIGLEYEFYAVESDSYRLRRVPRSLLECLGFEREIGLHNAELTSGVHPCSGAGLSALKLGTEAKIRSFQRQASEADIRFVSDGMWTIGPATNTTEGYLTEATHEEGISLAINVSNAVRYHGFASVDEHTPVAGTVALPGATIEADTAGPVSLTASIQPHVQPRRAADLPAYHNNALRVAGPVLAIAVNSPFLPPDLYDDGALTRRLLLEDTHAETRVPLYEGLMNPKRGEPKVRFPEDIDTAAEAVDRIAADAVIVPALIEGGERFDDAFVHFRHKHGSYWRWVRPVFDGPSAADASARIEFRPLPGQPTLPDTIALVAAVAGLLTGLSVTDHPVTDLPWAVARENFYAAVEDGLSADLEWITASGDRTSETGRLYEDLFDVAVAGLEARGLTADEATARLRPLRDRVDAGITPARWKREAVRRSLDAGAPPDDAVRDAQRAYIREQGERFYDGSLVDWPAG